MKKIGIRMFNDRFAFSTRGCGIGVVPITADGSIFLGERKIANEESGYGGELASINGWVEWQ